MQVYNENPKVFELSIFYYRYILLVNNIICDANTTNYLKKALPTKLDLLEKIV
jgi:hypothetical protein